MQLSESEIKLVKENKSQFVSLKYIGDEGGLKQVDASFNNINDGKLFVCSNEINLKPIDNKNFIDPFRSFPTTSFFCENIASKYNSRCLATKLLSKPQENFIGSLSAEISFWILEDETQAKGTLLSADPIDKYANLRSDIVSTLESINIGTTIHFHGSTCDESVIGIRGRDVVDLADNIIITKFIIANIADSYGFNIKFTALDSKKSSISIVINEQSDGIGNLSNTIEKNTKQTVLSLNKHHAYGFELGKIHLYKTTTSNTVLKINLIFSDLFIPYLALADLLLYSVDKSSLNNEMLQYFSK